MRKRWARILVVVVVGLVVLYFAGTGPDLAFLVLVLVGAVIYFIARAYPSNRQLEDDVDRTDRFM